MKATLTIELPNDFQRGKGKKMCRFYIALWDGDRPFCTWISDDCNTDNCPLEIQENNNDD